MKNSNKNWTKLEVNNIHVLVPYFQNEIEVNSFFNSLDTKQIILFKKIIYKKIFIKINNFFLYLHYWQSLYEEVKNEINNLKYEFALNSNKIDINSKFFWIKKYKFFKNETYNNLKENFKLNKEKLLKNYRLNKKNKLREFKNELILQKKLLGFLKNKIITIPNHKLVKNIYNELKTYGFEKIVKLYNYKGRQLNNINDWKSKKKSIWTKAFLLNNYFIDRFIELIKGKLEYKAYKKILKYEYLSCKKIVHKEKILIDALGNYHFLKQKDDEIIPEKNIGKYPKTQLKADLKTLKFNNYASLIDNIKFYFRQRKLLKYKYRLTNWNYNAKTSWEKKLKFKTIKYKNDNLILFDKEMRTVEKRKNKLSLQLKKMHSNFFTYHFGFVKRWFIAKKVFYRELFEYKKEIKLKSFNYKSLHGAIYKFKKDWNNKFLTILYDDSIVIKRQEIIVLNNKMKEMGKQNRIIVQSIIDDTYNQTPIYREKIWKFLITFISFFLPGTGQLINKQIIKGCLMLFLIPLLILFLCYSFGLNTGLSNQILGLITLGGIDNTVWDPADSRFYIVKGCIAIIFLVLGLIIMLVSARDAWWNAIAIEKGARCKKWSSTKKYLITQGYPLLASFPAFICILFITFLPIMSSILLAFTNYSYENLPPRDLLKWVDFQQFTALFSDKYHNTFIQVLIWTIIWTLGTSLLSILIGFFYAIILNSKRMVFKSFFRLIFLLPWAIPGFISMLFFKELFWSDGPLAEFFNQYKWFTNGTLAKIMLLMINTWLFNTTTFLMATGLMQSISPDLYEAAKIDGASNLKQSFKITLPILLSAMAPILIGAFVGGFNSFGIIFMITDGGPEYSVVSPIAGQTDTLVSVLYKLVRAQNLGLASALNVLISIFIILVPGWAIARTKIVKGDNW